ncbi:MAG: hypothetical protein IJC06_01365 [Clostridia bacterium]|nr:hypothetical protein [Clostridia bacterium]
MKKNIITTVVFALLVFGISVLCVFCPSPGFSESERRELASFPEISVQSISDGSFMSQFETYATERFPFRDLFRSIKANFATKVFMKKDNNGLFAADGHISKIDNEKNPAMMKHAEERFLYLYETYIKGKTDSVYFSVIPDKNFLLARENGYPSLNYEEFIDEMKQKVSYMKYIDVTSLLDIDDFYTTDTHWRQEKITDIAVKIGNEMGTDVMATYKENVLDKPFYGVYSGQIAMNFPPDEIVYLTNETLDNATVTYYGNGIPEKGEMYNMKKASGKDPYEMFLSGTMPVLTIENDNAKTDKELIMFRDSYGSSLAPLLVSGYSKITVLDTRYIKSEAVGSFADFNNADVLFIYSTTLLNNSLAIR